MSRVISLITWYNPSKSSFDNMLRIVSQSDMVFICDNSADSHKYAISGIEKCCYIHHGENMGISLAFNTVLKDSCYGWQPDDFIIFFDQDSVIDKLHIQKLVQEYINISKQGISVGCIGPIYYDINEKKNKIPKNRKYINENSFICANIITSSMLCRYDTIEKIGFFNEHIFLDLADWDLCWRLKYIGKNVCMTGVSILKHSVGNGVYKIGLLKLHVGNAFREYYQIRDSLKLILKKYVPMKYKALFMLMVFIRTPLHVLFLPNGKQRLFYVLKGIIDYLKNIDGEFDSNCK